MPPWTSQLWHLTPHAAKNAWKCPGGRVPNLCVWRWHSGSSNAAADAVARRQLGKRRTCRPPIRIPPQLRAISSATRGAISRAARDSGRAPASAGPARPPRSAPSPPARPTRPPRRYTAGRGEAARPARDRLAAIRCDLGSVRAVDRQRPASPSGRSRECAGSAVMQGRLGSPASFAAAIDARLGHAPVCRPLPAGDRHQSGLIDADGVVARQLPRCCPPPAFTSGRTPAKVLSTSSRAVACGEVPAGRFQDEVDLLLGRPRFDRSGRRSRHRWCRRGCGRATGSRTAPGRPASRE